VAGFKEVLHGSVAQSAEPSTFWRLVAAPEVASAAVARPSAPCSSPRC